MAIYRVTRTSQPGLAPASGSLVPGQLAVEMATQPNPRMWVGVPTNIDPTGRRLIVSGGGGGGGGGIPEAPTDGAIYGRNGESESWAPVLPLAGGTMAGMLTLNSNAITPMEAVPLGQIGTVLGITVSAVAPANPSVGQLWYNTNTGVLMVASGSPPAFAAVPGGFGFLPLTGGQMLGNLILNGPPTSASNPDQAATVGYVDGLVTGALQFIGTMDGTTGEVTYTTSSGITSSFLVNPATVKDSFIIVAVAGTIPAQSPYLGGTTVAVGDWVISDGTTWYVILVSGEEVLAENVAVAPPILGATDAQTAMTALLGNFDLYAPIASPGLQGIPTTPTPPVNDHSLQIANTAWVEAQIALALQTLGGNVDSVLFIGDMLGAASEAGSGDFYDQIVLAGDSSGNSPSTLPNFITSVSMTGDASSL